MSVDHRAAAVVVPRPLLQECDSEHDAFGRGSRGIELGFQPLAPPQVTTSEVFDHQGFVLTDTWFRVAVMWLIVLSTVGGYGCCWLCVQHMEVVRTSTLLYLTPPEAAVWAWLIFSQPITP